MQDPNKQDWVNDVRREVGGMARDGMKHPSTPTVLTGAAIGAVAGMILPVVGIGIGAIGGAGVALYQRLKK